VLGDREISAFRRGYYELLSRAYLEPPDGTFLHLLRQGVDARVDAAQNLHPALAEGWRILRACLVDHADHGPTLGEAVADEYGLLFISPVQPAIMPYESWYMEKEPYGPSLAAVRAFLHRVGLEKRESLPEPEDHIACEFEIMGQLIVRQEGAAEKAEEERWLHLQGEFLRSHLLPWVLLVCRDLEQHQAAKFYQGMAILARGFIELEQEALVEWGPPTPRRDLLAARVERWGGPTFDPLQIGKKKREGAEGEEAGQQGPACP